MTSIKHRTAALLLAALMATAGAFAASAAFATEDAHALGAVEFEFDSSPW